MRSRASAILATIVVATGLSSAPVVANDAQAANHPQEGLVRIALSEPVSTSAVLKAAEEFDLTVLSLRHSGATTGEMLVGDTPLAQALEMYRETDVQNFGVAPSITSLVTKTAPAPGLVIGGSSPASVDATSSSSTDPTPDDDGAAPGGTGKAWAPQRGTLRAYNSSTTGAERQIRHTLRWDSRIGLDSYEYEDDQFAYEHDTKLYDPDPYALGAGFRQTCRPQHWMDGDTRIVSSNNVPNAAGLYADNARASDECGIRDVSFGIFDPEKLSTGTDYRVVVGSNAGQASSSNFELQGSKSIRNCDFETAWCVSLGSDPREGYDMFVNADRGWRFPGCYSWYRNDANPPVKGSC